MMSLVAAVAIPAGAMLGNVVFECRPSGAMPHRKHNFDEDSEGLLFCARCDYQPRVINEGRKMLRDYQE